MEILEIAKLITIFLFAYLIGSIPFGLVLTKSFYSGEDIRKNGSGNIGATNVGRVAGKTLGIFTLTGDMLKGVVPVYIAVNISGLSGYNHYIFISMVALAAFSGHLYPVFLKFKDGGKGVATAAGCFMVLCPKALLTALIVFIIVVCLSRRVSAGSLSGALVLPIAVYIFSRSFTVTGCALVITVLIIIRHKDNIERLIAGTEPAAWKKGGVN
ncbi:MAG: glycerol-3-phosphate 1-O-acyltransferase PlsY [Desulfobacteraceae bacterium]|jgi:acyl phosphate:glycerol-3-phosphate acyltransferase|nr:glycerol-3-phosphate 1-O-acyltransferase PlsY [Desulfobacteraceae bacterium]